MCQQIHEKKKAKCMTELQPIIYFLVGIVLGAVMIKFLNHYV